MAGKTEKHLLGADVACLKFVDCCIWLRKEKQTANLYLDVLFK